MPDNARETHRVTLTLSRGNHWLLHHILLDRIEQEETAADPTGVDPPPVAVFQAFEQLDSGEASLTVAQLEAVQTVLAEYQHATTWWESERSQLEQLLHHVTDLLEQHQTALPAD